MATASPSRWPASPSSRPLPQRRPGRSSSASRASAMDCLWIRIRRSATLARSRLAGRRRDRVARGGLGQHRARAPAGRLRPRDPADPAYSWELDAAVRDATAQGFKVMLLVTRAPPWAEGPNRPDLPIEDLEPGAWKPDPAPSATSRRRSPATRAGSSIRRIPGPVRFRRSGGGSSGRSRTSAPSWRRSTRAAPPRALPAHARLLLHRDQGGRAEQHGGHRGTRPTVTPRAASGRARWSSTGTCSACAVARS